VRPKRCPTSSNPALLRSWMVVCPSSTLLMMLLLPGWPTMGLNRIRKKKKKKCTCGNCISYNTTLIWWRIFSITSKLKTNFIIITVILLTLQFRQCLYFSTLLCQTWLSKTKRQHHLPISLTLVAWLRTRPVAAPVLLGRGIDASESSCFVSSSCS